MKFLVTGAAGFIGMHVAARLLERGDEVVGVDSLNGYYDVKLKQDRLANLAPDPNFRFAKLDLADRAGAGECLKGETFDCVIHLAAQAGVRYSLTNPHAYVDSNLVAFTNILEICRERRIKHLVYASSSSVYGANIKVPFSVSDNVDRPLSLYAATKKANELMAHTYSHLFQIPTTGLRFFTVYGPWGRPDMALFKFTDALFAGLPIDVYNHGDMQRDFTYIDDIVEGVIQVADRPPTLNGNGPGAGVNSNGHYVPYKIYNIGNNRPTGLMRLIELLEQCTGKKADKNMLPLEPGDVLTTFADVDDLMRDTGFKPGTPIETGVQRFVEWYRAYYHV
jgi:UDP-glucuronate 4-epimerase